MEIKFFRANTSPETIETGNIWFDTSTHIIKIKTQTGYENYGVEIKDARLEGSKLIITKEDDSTLEVELSSLTDEIKNYTINGMKISTNPVIENATYDKSGLLSKEDKKLLDSLALNMLYYGVEWKPDVADPSLTRIGNMNYHKTLPIQSEMKGCIYNPKEKRVVYWLDESDWKYKKGGNPNKGQTEDLARLDGYDGEVMVYVPEFWIRSWDEADRRAVCISPVKINDSWEHQPALFVGAYKDTVLNSVPENMGYLSTLEVNAAVCIANSETYCRGGANRPEDDNYEDPYRRTLGKPRTNVSRPNFRIYERKSGKEILSYRQYKNVLYWLWVIEYATFNSQAAYNSELTADGYHQGGMGPGITNFGNWRYYNYYQPITPNGFTNNIGNGTGTKSLVVPDYQYYVGPINDLSKAEIGSEYGNVENGVVHIQKINSDNKGFSCKFNNIAPKATYKVSGMNVGQTLQFKLSGEKEVIAELTENGTITVEWPANNKTRQFEFTVFEENVNIYVNVESAEGGMINFTGVTVYPFRWRGLENTFGDIWNNVDGIIIDADTSKHAETGYVYTTDDPTKYGDTNADIANMTLSGLEIRQTAAGDYIKEWDLGFTSEIIPRMGGASSTTYKCDYHYIGNNNDTLRTLLLGGSADDGGGYAGLGYFYSHDGVADASFPVGFRPSCLAN